MKIIHKNGSKKIKFDDFEIERYKFHQYKSPILINNIDVNKIVVSNIISCGKTILDILLDIKMVKKLDLYEYSFQN